MIDERSGERSSGDEGGDKRSGEVEEEEKIGESRRWEEEGRGGGGGHVRSWMREVERGVVGKRG